MKIRKSKNKEEQEVIKEKRKNKKKDKEIEIIESSEEIYGIVEGDEDEKE